jgi:hypothetical protein
MKERALIASTESLGVFGTPREWKDVWNFATKDPRFGGFEMIGWGGPYMDLWTRTLISQAGKEGCTIAGIHGRNAGDLYRYPLSSALSMGALNRFIISTPDLFRNYGHTMSYVLVHASEMRMKKNVAAAMNSRFSLHEVSVENHVLDPIDRDIQIIKNLCHIGVRAGMTFDFAHYDIVRRKFQPYATYEELWSDSLKTLSTILRISNTDGGTIPVHLHIPYGANADDSIRFHEITPSMWNNMASCIQDFPDVKIVIENPESGRDLVKTSTSSRDIQRERNHMMVDTLTAHGII